MQPSETVKYLELIEAYLRERWLETRDPKTRTEIEHIAAEIAELRKDCEQ